MSPQRKARFWTALLAMLLCVSIVFAAVAEYRTIPFGEESGAVKTLQKALKSKGYYKGTVDGKFGQATRSAVYRYQRAIGLKADGKPGNTTLTALYDGVSKLNDGWKNRSQTKDPQSSDTIYYGSAKGKVRALQRALKAAGYYRGSIDGKFGDLTELAVRKFQSARGLHVDGMAGRATLNSLNGVQSKVKLSMSFVLSVGSSGTKVSRVQTRLSKLGYKITDKKGYYGSSTANAIRKYQHANAQTQTGKLTQSQYEAFLAATK